METEESLKEYNRRKQRESRARKKLLNQNGGTTEAKALSLSVKSNCQATITIHLDS